MQPIHYYETDSFVINEFYKYDNEHWKYISKINIFMTQTCNYKLYCNKMKDTYLTLTKIWKM